MSLISCNSPRNPCAALAATLDAVTGAELELDTDWVCVVVGAADAAGAFVGDGDADDLLEAGSIFMGGPCVFSSCLAAVTDGLSTGLAISSKLDSSDESASGS